MISFNTLRQLLKYALVGLGCNFLLYVIYLLLTAAKWGYITAVTWVYVIGISLSFVLNRHWTFRYQNHYFGSLRRYFSAYILVYIGNMLALFALVDGLKLSHQVVQGVLIIIAAGFLFILQKYWVFSKK